MSDNNQTVIASIQRFAEIFEGDINAWRLLVGREVTVKNGIETVEIANVREYPLLITVSKDDKITASYTKEAFLKTFGLLYPLISITTSKGYIDKDRTIEVFEENRNLLLLELNDFFEAHEFDRAEFFYLNKCQGYISRLEYEEKKKVFLQEIKSYFSAKINEVLARYCFEEADKFYRKECSEYITNKEYQERKNCFLAKKKDLLISELDKFFRDDFLDADEFYHLECQPYISKVEYNRKKSNFCQTWVEKNLGNKPDLEQSAAIGAVNNHVQVVARAGSGKTSTLVNRTLFLQKHCGIHPSEILLLAFNRKAAAEIKERIQKHLGEDVPHVMTFHALANRLVHPEEKINFDEKDGEQSLSLSMQAVISEYLDKPVYYAEIRNLMRKHFKIDSESLIAYVKYRQSLPKEGIDGRYYKSRGEKIIADFLFEHDIPYTYEKSFWL